MEENSRNLTQISPLQRPQKRSRNEQAASGALFPDSVLPSCRDEVSFSINLPGSKSDRLYDLPSTAGKGKPEEKHRKLSCKECRRLKLKCDRVFPCQSCVKRGCGSLCPEGALTSGRGSRFILANTEQLHEKISELSDRVRQLEEALEELHLQSANSNQTHPLLIPDLLRIKTSQELYGVSPTSDQGLQCPPSSEISKDDPMQLGDSIGALTITKQPPYKASHTSDLEKFKRESTPPDVPPDILQLSTTFPFPWSVDLSIRKRIRDSLPPREEAQRICEQARQNALWQYNLDASETFLPNLLHYCYTTNIEDLRPRRLALFLMVMSIGSLVDLNRPLGSLNGEAYHHLARAAVCEIPLMEEPDFDELHALFFMIWYHLIFSDNKKAVGYAWNLMGFVAKLAQGLGLHRDNSRLKAIPEEHERRKAVFWELLNMDCRMSLSLGRPPSLCLSHVDTKPPSYVGSGIYVPREEIIYHEWKNSFFIHCLAPMLEAMTSVVPPDYERIIYLDKAARDFDVPALLDEIVNSGASPRFLSMQRALVTMGRNIALLQLHRRYFTEAMNLPLALDLHHRYAPSVLATYLGASSLITALQILFEKEEQLSARFLHFWFNTFSASVTLSLLISRAPTMPMATCALQYLERACHLFRRAARILPFSAKALPIMNTLGDKSRKILMESRPSPSQRGDGGFLPYPHYPQQHSALPKPFLNVHPLLAESSQRIMSNPTHEFTNGDESYYEILESAKMDTDSFLPDIYRFASVGLSMNDRYTFATPRPTPFVPSSTRLEEKENFNFEYGALDTDLVEETSYMAWF